MTSNPQTFAEFDAAELARMNERATCQQVVERAVIQMHMMMGDSRDRQGRWNLTDEAAESYVRELAVNGNAYNTGTRTTPAALLEVLDKNLYGIKILGEQISWCENFYRENPWTRWYPCLNSDGHIHSHASACPTLHRGGGQTSMGWETSLSGQPVSVVIEQLGPRLCSVCFPDAPAEHCRSLSDINRAGREAAKLAKQEAKYVKQLRPDEARIMRESYDGRVTTVSGCLAEIRTEVEFRDYYGNGEHPYHAKSVAGAANAVRVLLAREAAAPGTGKTQAEIDKVIASAVKSNIKNGARLNKDGSLAY